MTLYKNNKFDKTQKEEIIYAHIHHLIMGLLIYVKRLNDYLKKFKLHFSPEEVSSYFPFFNLQWFTNSLNVFITSIPI